MFIIPLTVYCIRVLGFLRRQRAQEFNLSKFLVTTIIILFYFGTTLPPIFYPNKEHLGIETSRPPEV
jgi:hypothetical protein